MNMFVDMREYNGCTCASLLHLLPFNLIQYSFHFILWLFFLAFFHSFRSLHFLSVWKHVQRIFFSIVVDAVYHSKPESFKWQSVALWSPDKWMLYLLNYWITKSMRRILSSFRLRWGLKSNSLLFECQRKKKTMRHKTQIYCLNSEEFTCVNIAKKKCD